MRTSLDLSISSDTLALVETTSDYRPTLLISSVAERRSDDMRETMLTKRLINQVASMAAECWEIVVSWGETDGVSGALSKLDRAHAVIVLGGPDVTPEFYGADDDYANVQTHFPRTDEAQITLAQTAVARGIPYLGICRGMQVLNIAQSGTLVQDICDTTGYTHTSPDLLKDFEFSRHTVNIFAGSYLSTTLVPGSEGALFPDGGLRTMIHSAHHQAVDLLGKDLVVSALADDHTIEAVEHTSAPAVGVQWHPEDPDADPMGLHLLLEQMCQDCPKPLAV